MVEDVDNLIGPGASFGDLEVLEEIGSGAFAVVYRAHHALMDRAVALKVIDPTQWAHLEDARDEILAEARMVARIDDPHVVTLHQVHRVSDVTWAFEMEYLNGGSLRDRLKTDGPLDPSEARRILEALLRGLDAAHRHKIVHHDIKPGNVLLGKDGAVKLTDFGLGRFVAEDDLARGPRGHLRGTPYYMAPEIVMGRPGQMASDLWSVGVVLYQMLSGRLPFPGRTTEALFLAIQNATPSPLPDATPSLLAGLALRCLAKSPSDRPPSVAALLEELVRQGRFVTAAAVDPKIAAAPATILTGRGRELGTLRTHLQEVTKGLGRADLILGEAGIGKTALMQEVGREARAQGFRWVEVRLTPLEGLRRPLAQALHDTVAGDDLSGSGAGSSASRGFEILRRIAEEGGSTAAELPLQSGWEIEQALRALATSRPLALVIEDVHHCDTEEFKMLAGLAGALAADPILLALTYRTRDPAGSESGDSAPASFYDLASCAELERIELEPLGDRAIRGLLEQVSGLHGLPHELVERVIRDSDGVPLYALELYRHLEASGEIERGKDAVRITERWGRADLPGPLRDMVRRRLTGLAEDERNLLDTAAVAGVSFDGAWLAEVMDVPLLGVLRTLQRLFRERALVLPQEQGYRFAHGLYQEAIYKEMAPDLRRALHRAWAETLTPKLPATSVDPEALGWHWEQAGEPDRAAPELIRAAGAAVQRGEHARAWRLAERAGILDEGASPEGLRENFDVLVSLSATFVTEKEALRIEALHERLTQAARELGDEEMGHRVLVMNAWHHVQRRSGRPVDVVALENAAVRLPSGNHKANAWWLLGRTFAELGDFAKAREALQCADAAHREYASHPDEAHQSLYALGSILRHECDLEAAKEVFERLAVWTLKLSGKTPQAALARAQAILCGSQAGHTEGAGDSLEDPIRWLERTEQPARAGHALVTQAQLYEAEGRIDDSRRALGRAEPTLRDAALGAAYWLLLRLKARLQIAAGDLEASEPTLDDAGAAVGTLPREDCVALEEETAFLETVWGEHEAASSRLLAELEILAPSPNRFDLGRLLVELTHYAVLGLDLSRALPTLGLLAAERSDHPPMIDLALRISRVVLRTDLGEVDAGALERAAAAARDPRLGWHQATMGAIASLLSARANLLAGEREAAGSLLLDARQRAQRLQHVWLELRALQLARDADLDVDPVRVRALVEQLQKQNPTDRDRTAHLVASWTSGMPRA